MTKNHDGGRLDFLIILLTGVIVLGLLLTARGNRMPMLGVNDLSRWATVYSLAERNTYDIDQIPWPMTIDRVQINGRNYSSKPPLLPTLLAAEYLLLKKLSFGKINFNETPETVIRFLLGTVNLIPLLIFLFLYSRFLDRLDPDPWTRLFSMLAAGFGTYLTSYSITLNNHTIAAFCSFFALYPTYRIWVENQRIWWLYALAGFFSAFAAVNEFPALSLLTFMGAGLFGNHPKGRCSSLFRLLLYRSRAISTPTIWLQGVGSLPTPTRPPTTFQAPIGRSIRSVAVW